MVIGGKETIDLEAGAAALKEWIVTQPHLPQNIHPLLLKRYIHSTKGDLEYAKKIFVLGYTIRQNNPIIFGDRDPQEEKIQRILKAIDMVPLPCIEGCSDKFVFYRLVDCDPDKFHFNDVIRTFFVIADSRMIQPDIPMTDGGDIPIFDMNGFTLRHLTKVILSTLRVYMRYTQEAHPVRLKAIHVINCTPFLDRVMYIVRPFMKKRVSEMLHFHLPNSESIYEHVPKDILPDEYGGKQSIAKHKADWFKRLELLRDYFTDDTRWKIDESRKAPVVNELAGTLRQLEID
ncbi:alpha-tocopherol transfer protein [Uranotaenia lowii]|uniref:alpha-tocopherol transfer protein n=1 Tax=Uranotaenia lowii TaxID=190385 RepID=UPI00247A8CB0|nr:alpha-tocopherol transfer protein [Uranotaenia lowii]XP_055601863.1 alpha-tocopherol transfer protein [Uranotaenia lowii]